MTSYTQNELHIRQQIIDSQVQLLTFLNADIVNKLVKLFDRRYDDNFFM